MVPGIYRREREQRALAAAPFRAKSNSKEIAKLQERVSKLEAKEAKRKSQKRMKCPECDGVGIYDEEQDRFFCMDCGYDSNIGNGDELKELNKRGSQG